LVKLGQRADYEGEQIRQPRNKYETIPETATIRVHSARDFGGRVFDKPEHVKQRLAGASKGTSRFNPAVCGFWSCRSDAQYHYLIRALLDYVERSLDLAHRAGDRR
jgi:hypothetical protein